MTTPRPLVMISGLARSGKDTLGDLLAAASSGFLTRGLSTSQAYCALHNLDRDALCRTAEGRIALAQAIDDYNTTDQSSPCRLYKEMVYGVRLSPAFAAFSRQPATDILVGIRRYNELKAVYEMAPLTGVVPLVCAPEERIAGGITRDMLYEAMKMLPLHGPIQNAQPHSSVVTETNAHRSSRRPDCRNSRRKLGIWVERDGCVDPTLTYTKEEMAALFGSAFLVVENNGTLDELRDQAELAWKWVQQKITYTV